MATYRFATTITVYGYIEREIGDQDPAEAAEELLEEMPSTLDMKSIGNSDVDIDDWHKVS